MPDRSPRVLFVEDDIGKRYVIARQLRAAGFELVEAATGAEGLALLSPEFDIAILDVKLPDMTGWDICKRIKGDPVTASIMVLGCRPRWRPPRIARAASSWAPRRIWSTRSRSSS